MVTCLLVLLDVILVSSAADLHTPIASIHVVHIHTNHYTGVCMVQNLNL